MKLVVLASVVTACLAAVIEATDKDLDALLSKGVPTLLDIYASWCGHCKRFSPVFDELAAVYENAQDKVQFIKIDGDANRKAAKKFNIEYFPTIKWVDADGADAGEISSRDLDSLKELVETRANVKAGSTRGSKDALKPTSHVVQLDESSFEKELDGKAGLVAFTTTWCGHCKRLKPEWEKLAQLYARDEDILVANVDCTDGEAEGLMNEYGVRGYPTIISVSKDGTKKPYAGGRDLSDFVAHFQRNGDSFREVSGKLSPLAGVIPELADIAPKVVGSGEASEEATNFVKQLKKAKSQFEDKYLRIVAKASKDATFPLREVQRISKLLTTAAVAPEKIDDLTVRLNILRQFTSEGLVKEDL